MLVLNVGSLFRHWSMRIVCVSVRDCVSGLFVCVTRAAKKSVPLVPLVQGGKVICGEVSTFYMFLYISEGKFAIYSCCGTEKQNIFCSPVCEWDCVSVCEWECIWMSLTVCP